MIGYYLKMAGVGLAWVGVLWWGLAPDVKHPTPTSLYYAVEGETVADYVPVPAPRNASDAPKPATPTVTTPGPKTCSEWAEYGRKFGWPEIELSTLTVIMGQESACNPAAVGDNGASRGLLQIHCPTWVQPSKYWPNGWAAAHGFNVTCDGLHDPATNLAIGLLIWAGVEGSDGGWWNWTTYRP
jgi:hypothetical protein